MDDIRQDMTGPIDNFEQEKIRLGARRFVNDSLTAEHVANSLANAMAGLHKASLNLPLSFQAVVGHVLDKMDVIAADPANQAAIATWAKSVVLPLLDP